MDIVPVSSTTFPAQQSPAAGFLGFEIGVCCLICIYVIEESTGTKVWKWEQEQLCWEG